jgi:Na+/proline symporter
LLVVGSSVTHDLLPGDRDARARLRLSRGVVALVAAVAVVLALLGTDTLFASVLFAWTALGASFGPLLLVTLWRGRVGPTRSLAAMLVGCSLAVIAYSVPATKGTAAERVLPFVAALLVLLVPLGRFPQRPAAAYFR